MLEHMLFKGTDRIGTKDYAKEVKLLREIEAAGETLDRLRMINPANLMIPELEKKLSDLQKAHAEYVDSSPYDRIYSENGGVGFNASTSRDRTGYYIELPSSKLELWAQLESERLRNPVMREYYLERNNVMEERLMRYESSGTGALFERFLAAAYLAHPYRHPIIGWGSVIPFLSINDIRNFYYSHYTPANMTIAVVGMQNTDETVAVLEKYFGAVPARPEILPTPVREPAMNGERRVTLEFESTPYVIIGWHKPAYPDRTDYAFDVLAEILSGGKSSVLHRNLVLGKGTAHSVSCWNGTPGARYDNLFVVFGAPGKDKTSEELESAIYAEIEKIKIDIQPADIERAVNRMESELVFSLSDNKGLADLLTYYQTIYRDWKAAAVYIKAVKSVTPEEIKAAASKYLVQTNRTVAVLIQKKKESDK
jgi:predicted Zn-dependent peptidase